MAQHILLQRIMACPGPADASVRWQTWVLHGPWAWPHPGPLACSQGGESLSPGLHSKLSKKGLSAKRPGGQPQGCRQTCHF